MEPKENPSFKILLLFTLGTSCFIFHIWLRTLVLTTGFEVGALQGQVNKLEAQLVQIKSIHNRLLNPQKLEETVQEWKKTGHVLLPPRPEQIFYIEESP